VSTWGSGLAGQAHDEVLYFVRERGHLRAWLRVLEANGRARRFYQNRGDVDGPAHAVRVPPHPTSLCRDAGRLESVGTCGLGLSRFVPAGVVLGTDLVRPSATVRRYGEPARFRPGGVVALDTGCSMAGPRRADVD